MANISTKRSTRLDDLPNIGKSIAADLRSLGVVSAEQLAKMDSMETYQTLASIMGRRHDPCVLYTLLAVAHFQKTDERLPWWHFTAQGKQ